MLREMKPREFEAMFGVMEQSFPTDEYRPANEQKALLSHSRYTVYVFAEEETVDAFLAVWQFETFAFLEHFAVAPRLRNRGLGSAMLKELAERLSCRICLEVELPDTPLAARRIDFYKRAGFAWNAYPYVQPPISQGKQPVPLRLMTTCGELSLEEFERVKKILYQEVYKIADFGSTYSIDNGYA